MNIPLTAQTRDQHIFTLNTKVLPAIDKIGEKTLPQWGRMSSQHMIEHLSQTLIFSSILSTKPRVEAVGDQIENLKGLIYTDMEFPHNLMNPIYKEGLPPLKFESIVLAKNQIQTGLNIFFKSFKQNPDGYSFNPFMGDLDFDQLLVLHVKHFRHHLKQFGVQL